MSVGLYSHTTRGTGTVLTAAIYNSDHTNHITNQNPSMTGAYSDNVTQMRAKQDPGGVGTEALAASLAIEIEYLRFTIARITGKTHWYEAPIVSLQGVPTLPITTTGIADANVTNSKLADMAAWTLKMRNNASAGVPQDVTINGLNAIAAVDLAADQFPIWDANAGVMGKSALQTAIIALMALDRQFYTADDTWNKPSKGTIAWIQCWGAGGSGGRGGNGDGGGGGGGGAYVERWMHLSDLGATVAVTVGTGAPAATVDNTSGTAGEDTTFGSHVTAYGGGGGDGTGSTGCGGGGGGGMLGAGASASSIAGANGGLPRSTMQGDVSGGGTPSQMVLGAPGIVFGGSPAPGNFNVAGGGGGGRGANAAPTGAGGDAVYGGGGGGGGNGTGTAAAGIGGGSIYGGAGGGGGGEATAGGAGGTSLFGGAGGAGGFDANAGTAGTAPGGGGGGSELGNSGAGAAGRVIVTVF